MTSNSTTDAPRKPRRIEPERDNRPPVRILFEMPAFCGPSFRAALEEFSAHVAARLDSRNRTLKEDATTRALVGLGDLRRATCAAIAEEDPHYAD